MYEYSKIDSALLNYVKNNKNLQKYFSSKFSGVYTTSYCGNVYVGDKNYTILPKIVNDDLNTKIFIYMLSYAFDTKLYNITPSKNDTIKSELFDVFIEYFTQILLDECKKGLYKSYISQEANQNVLKSKWLINQHIKQNFTNHKIYCEFDEFSPNNKLNKFFLYAIKLLQKCSNNTNLHRLELLFDEVEYEIIDISRIDIYFDRLNDRFRLSYDLAIILLNSLLSNISDGEKNSFAFLFDMNIVYERFLSKLIKEIYPDTIIQHKNNLAEQFVIKPDILIIEDNKASLVIDTKYKKITHQKKISTCDRYQAYAYGMVYATDVMLLYPKHLDSINDTTIVLNNDDATKQVNLLVRSIDLGCENECEYCEYIKMMKNRVKEIITDRRKNGL